MGKEKDTIIKKQFKILPKEIQDAITAADLPYKIQEIGKKHKLHVDQMGILDTETMLVLLGLLHPDDYSSELQARLQLTGERTRAIVEDANRIIFQDIQGRLKQFYEDQVSLEERRMGVEEEAEIVPPPTELEEKERGVLEKTGVTLVEEEQDAAAVGREEEVSEIKSEEESVLKTAGVEVMSKKPGPPKPAPIPEEVPETVKREDVLKGIEQPEPTPTKETITEKKLRGVFKMSPRPEAEAEKGETLSDKNRIKSDPYLENI